MRRAVKAWLEHNVDMDDARECSVGRLALRVSGKTVPVACMINAMVHCALDRVGLLPYPMAQALIIGFATTASITFVVTFIFMLVIGRAIRDIAIQRNAFERLSRTDALSGVRSRRAFFEEIEGPLQAGQLILIDVDRFKSINDTYGHLAGDEVIRGVGQTLRSLFAGMPAVIGRIGGEEFAVFLPAMACDCQDPAEMVRAAVAAMVVAGVERPITISLGVAVTGTPRSATEVFSAADRALYLAKDGGRNRVVRESETCPASRRQEAPAETNGPSADAA